MRLFLLLIALLAAPADLRITGLLRTPQHNLAVLQDGPNSSVVQPEAVDGTRVILEDRTLPFPHTVPNDEGINLAFVSCDRFYAAKLVALATDRPLLAGPGAEGTVTLTLDHATQQQANQALHIESNLLTPLHHPLKAPGLNEHVSLDLVRAGLPQALRWLGDELHIKVTVAPEVQGQISVSARNVPAGWLIGTMLALQEQPYTAHFQNGELTVK